MENTGQRILIVDDEPQIRRFLKASLSAHDYVVVEAEDGKNAIRAATVEKPDLIVLDLGLPDLDGQDVISEVRGWSDVPIIVLSIRSDETDKVTALDRGANDYVTKPFGMGELLARIRANLRQKRDDDSPASTELEAGLIKVDVAKRQVTKDGRAVRLSKKEFEILKFLMTHKDVVVTHQQVLSEVWGPAYAEETQYLRVYVGQLRQKLEAEPSDPALIVTEPGVGYRLRSATS